MVEFFVGVLVGGGVALLLSPRPRSFPKPLDSAWIVQSLKKKKRTAPQENNE